MKIELISENQIKCTLSRSDLASRQLKISELAYGTEKAKGLFRDMMEQASSQFGFEVNDQPLIIEAIPVSMDNIVLMITKVDQPDDVEGDLPPMSTLKDLLADDSSADSDCSDCADCCEDMSDDEVEEIVETSVQAFTDHFKNARVQAPSPAQVSAERLFVFDSLITVMDLASKVSGFYFGVNSLYKSAENGRYYLLMDRSGAAGEDFPAALAAASEYGSKELFSLARGAYIREHFNPIVVGSALQSLANV